MLGSVIQLRLIITAINYVHGETAGTELLMKTQMTRLGRPVFRIFLHERLNGLLSVEATVVSDTFDWDARSGALVDNSSPVTDTA